MNLEYKRCTYCDFDKINFNAKKCRKCGEWLEKSKNLKVNKNIDEYYKIAIIALSGILICCIITATVFYLSKSNQKNGPLPTQIETEPQITYECYVKNNSPLKDFVDCNSKNGIKFYNNPDQVGEPFLVIDKEKLIQSCADGDCYDQKIKENQDYIISNTKIKNKKILVYFTSKPNEQDFTQVLNKISQNRNVNFGDEFEFIVGQNGESLLLSYDFFPIKMTLVNNKKTTHKSVIFDIENINLNENKNEFEFIDTNKIVVHNFNQIKTELNNFLSRNKRKENLKTTFDDLSKQITSATTDVNIEYIVYININDKNVDLPTNSLGYGFNNESCIRWQQYADRNNAIIENTYKTCIGSNDPEKQCSRSGMQNRSYYNYYSSILKQKKSLLQSNNITVIMNIEAEIPNEASCKNELKQIITTNY